MDCVEDPPLVFADRIIQRLVSNLFGATLAVEPNDSAYIKAVFRRCNGQWESISKGDIYHTLVLEKIITQWGSMPGRKKQSA